jgi:hypothetical protein
MQKRVVKPLSRLLIVLFVLSILLPIEAVQVKAVQLDDWSAYAAADFGGGTGTSGDPYLVSTPEQLAYLAKQANTIKAGGSGVLNNFSGKYIKLTADIDLSAHDWIPIGSSYKQDDFMPGMYTYFAFNGCFDGNSKTISGVKVNRPQSEKVGFFGITQNASISNLVLKDVEVIGKTSVGGLVGQLDWNSDASNCYVSGSVTGVSRVGGFSGYLRNSEGITRYCVSTANVTVPTDAVSPSLIGGFAGWHETNEYNLSRCYATGNVDGSAQGQYVGGFLGKTWGMSNCYATGNVTGKSYVGGFVGTAENSRILNNCYATGNVSGDSNIGGFLGAHNPSASPCTYNNCLAMGSVTGNTVAGGFAGNFPNGTIHNSYYVDDIGTNGFGSKSGSAVVTVCEKKSSDFFTAQDTYTTASNWYNSTAWDVSIWDFSKGYPSLKNMPEMKALSSDAGLVSVLSQTVTAGGEAGTSSEPKTAAVNVVTAVAAAAPGDIAVTIGAASVFYGTDSSFTTPSGSVSLKAGGATNVYIKVTAADGTTTLYYKVAICRAAPLSSDAGLVSVLSQTVTAGGEAGTSSEPKTASVNVVTAVAAAAPGDIAVTTGAASVFYGTDSSFTTPSGSVSLTAGGATNVYIKVTAADGTTTLYYKVAICRAAPLSSDAGLVSVLSQTVTAGGEAGTSSEPKTASVNVVTAVAAVASGDIAVTTGAASVFYGTDTSFTTPSGSVSLMAGGATNVYIKVTAADGTRLCYKVTINRAAAKSTGSNERGTETGSEGSKSPSESVQAPVTSAATTTAKTAIIIVNGKEQDAGKEKKEIKDGKSTVTVEVNNQAIESKIDEAIRSNTGGTGNTIQVTIADTKTEVVKVQLTGDIIKKLEKNAFHVSIKRSNVEYIIPAEEFIISKAAQDIGVLEADYKNIMVEIKMAELDEKVVEKFKKIAAANGAEMIFPPISFKITAKTTKADTTTREVEISKFRNYVERVMEIPQGVDPSKITTGIVFNPEGTYGPVPTEVYKKDGKWCAKLNSLTNSEYSVIWNPVSVKSVENHWAKSAVNDMASRMVIFSSDKFEPNKAITRADFVEYIVRALGLYREGAGHKNKFTDVSSTGERTRAILIASEYGIVTGYTDGTFKPDRQITREDAMTMYQRAMKITKLTGKDTDRYRNYTDFQDVSNWAKAYVKEVLAAHVFNGTSAKTISPKSNLTYAEAAQAIKNLLVESKLINK